MGQFYHYLVFDSNGKGIMHWNTDDETVDEFVRYCADQVENGNWDLDYRVSVNGPETKAYTVKELLDEYLRVLIRIEDAESLAAGIDGTDFNRIY